MARGVVDAADGAIRADDGEPVGRRRAEADVGPHQVDLGEVREQGHSGSRYRPDNAWVELPGKPTNSREEPRSMVPLLVASTTAEQARPVPSSWTALTCRPRGPRAGRRRLRFGH